MLTRQAVAAGRSRMLQKALGPWRVYVQIRQARRAAEQRAVAHWHQRLQQLCMTSWRRLTARRTTQRGISTAARDVHLAAVRGKVLRSWAALVQPTLTAAAYHRGRLLMWCFFRWRLLVVKRRGAAAAANARGMILGKMGSGTAEGTAPTSATAVVGDAADTAPASDQQGASIEPLRRPVEAATNYPAARRQHGSRRVLAQGALPRGAQQQQQQQQAVAASAPAPMRVCAAHVFRRDRVVPPASIWVPRDACGGSEKCTRLQAGPLVSYGRCAGRDIPVAQAAVVDASTTAALPHVAACKYVWELREPVPIAYARPALAADTVVTLAQLRNQWHASFALQGGQ